MGNISLKISEDDPEVAYLYLPAHPGKEIFGVVKKQVRALDLIPNYKGPDVYLDFDGEGVLIGIEILG